MRRNDDKFQSFLSMERQGLLLAGIALKTVRDEKKAKKEGMGPYDLDALLLLVDAELDYNESLED